MKSGRSLQWLTQEPTPHRVVGHYNGWVPHTPGLRVGLGLSYLPDPHSS